MQAVLEQIFTGLANLAHTARGLSPLPTGGEAVASVAIDGAGVEYDDSAFTLPWAASSAGRRDGRGLGSLGDGGGSGGEGSSLASRNDDLAREDGAARRQLYPKINDEASCQAHWFPVGASPISIMRLAATLGQPTLVTNEIFAPLSNLDGVSVQALVVRGFTPTDDVPLAVRMGVMCQAIITMANKSFPTPTSASPIVRDGMIMPPRLENIG